MTTLPLYRPTRSGHYPTWLRDAFLEVVDAFNEWDGHGPEPTIELRRRQLTITAVCDLLRGCFDLLPTMTCNVLSVERASTYAVGAERLKRMVAERSAAGRSSNEARRM